MEKKLKILINAYACNPYQGSEEGVGWGWVKMIAQDHEVFVIVASYHEEDINKFLDENPNFKEKMHFFYVSHKPWHYKPTKNWKKIENSILKPIMNYAYRLWLIDAYHLAKQLHHQYKFDLTHQLTYVGFRFPGYLWRLDIPFVWGPLGGLENTPWRFLPALGLKGAVYYTGRNVINTLHKCCLITPKLAFKKAQSGIISATVSIAKEIKEWYGMPSTIISEIGPPPNRADTITLRENDEIFKIAWSGEHLPGKALPLLLNALAQLPSTLLWQLDILGTGPLTDKWKQMAEELGISKQCRWHGKLPREDAVSTVHLAHTFVITSMKDLTSTVLLEALSQGVPVICPDHCGFSNVITENCGIKIELNSINFFTKKLQESIELLADNETYRRSLALGALERSCAYSWEIKLKQLNNVYRSVLIQMEEK